MARRRRLPTKGGAPIRLAVISDLHVDSNRDALPLLADAIRHAEPDVLVIAGDVTADGVELERTLAALRPGAREAVFVPGNHDLWCRSSDPSSRERYERIVPAHARAAGFHTPFAEDRVVLFGHRFVGVTGWYDYSLRNRAHDELIPIDRYVDGEYGMLFWADKTRVCWPEGSTLLDDPAICDRNVASLERQLAIAGDEPIVSVTHHLPFSELVTSPGLPWDFVNGFMGSVRLGERLLADPRVVLSISGHTHFGKDVVVPRRASQGGVGLRAVVSPLGYPREYKRMGYTLPEQVLRRVLVVELPDAHAHATVSSA